VRFLDIADSQTLDLDDEKKMLIAEAHQVAENLHKDIALCLLGSRKTYVKRLCEEYHAVIHPPGSGAESTYNSFQLDSH